MKAGTVLLALGTARIGAEWYFEQQQRRIFEESDDFFLSDLEKGAVEASRMREDQVVTILEVAIVFTALLVLTS